MRNSYLTIAVAVGAGLMTPHTSLAEDGAAVANLRVLSRGELPNDSRLGPLKDLNGYFPFQPPASPQEWENQAEKLRRQMLVATGLWPMPEKTPLNAVVHGRVERDGYTVEKVYFESYPGHFVTGNLYRPIGRSGKLPAVLSPHGHFPDARFGVSGPEQVQRQIEQGAERSEVNGRHALQAACAQLARMGCVALIYDMVGYADSKQILYEVAHFYSLKRPEMDTPADWGFFSVQADLRLQSIMGLQTWNSIRALDFVCSLPEVDRDRIGVTGASSGGTQTMLLCALDPRPRVAVPIVMVSTGMQGGCTCENCELLRIAAGNVDFAALFAPKPQAAIGANDWTKEMDTKGGPELKQLYATLGAADSVSIQSFLKFGHNFNLVSREAMYAWMNRQLNLGQSEPIVEQEIVPLTREEMTVWDEGHPRPPAGEEYERQLLRLLTEASQRQLARLVPRDANSLAEFRRTVGGAWSVMIGRDPPQADQVAFERVGEPAPLGDYLVTKGLLRYAPNKEELPTAILSAHPKQSVPPRVVIWLDPAGKAGLLGADGLPRVGVRKLLDAGVSVVGLDLAYQGEFLADGKPITQTRRVAPRNNRDSAAYTFGYNHSLFAQRVHDVMTAVAYFGQPQKNGNQSNRVDLVGLNGAGHWAAVAMALCRDRIDRAAIDTAGFRFAKLRSVYDPDFLPGAAKYFDLSGVIALCAPGKIWISDEASRDGRPEITKAAYKTAGEPAEMHWFDGPADAAEENAAVWLLK